MAWSQTQGKFYRLLITVALLALSSTIWSGCTFFGKQKDTAPAPTPGVLGNGTSIVGSWSSSYSSMSATGVPATALTMTFTFNPNGSAQVVNRNAMGAGTTCTGYGQYRTAGNNSFIFYLQSVAPADGSCALPPDFTFQNVRMSAHYFTYFDPSSNGNYTLLAEAAQSLAPVGVWNFAGHGGIDYLFLDPHGYFLMQVSDTGTQYLLEGQYFLNNGEMTLNYTDGNPDNVLGTQLFSQFVTNGTALLLDLTDNTGTSTLTGTKL